MKISHLVINGLRDNGVMAADSIPENFDLKAAFTIDRSFRSSSEKQKIDITADDVIELEFEDQTTWICEPGQLGEIFPETLTKNRSGDGGIEIPASISSDTVHRGAGEILLKVRNYIQTGNYAHEDILARLKAMEKATEEKGLRTARITELEGLIYADLYEYELALQKMENLLKMEEAKYDVSTIERYFNIRAKSYIMEYLKNDKKQRNYYLRKINDVLGEINLLFYLSPTSERYVLLASTTKRKALLQTDKEKMLGALEEASYYYMKAYSYKPSVNALGNWYQLETILNLAGKHKWNTDIKFNEEVYHLPGREHLETSLKEEIAKIQDNEFDNYWQMAKRINLKMNLFLLKASAEDMSLLKEVLADYKTL